MRADRLLSILLQLQGTGRLTGKELADRLEVSERTIHRDMDALSAAGVPVYALRGAKGGWQLDENWRTQVPGLDEVELQAMMMAQPRALGDPRLAAAAERAFGKLMAAMPETLRQQAASIRQRLYVDITGWKGWSEDLSMLPVVQEALSRDRQLSIRYARAGGERAERIVDPLGLVAKGATWYLFGRTFAGLRTYRVSRIETATILETSCERPPDFDLAAAWKSSTERFEERRLPYAVTLCMDPRTAERVRMYREVEMIPNQAAPEGWVTLRILFDGEGDACFVVLGLGSRVDIIAPESLRQSVADEVAATAARLAASSSSSTTM